MVLDNVKQVPGPNKRSGGRANLDESLGQIENDAQFDKAEKLLRSQKSQLYESDLFSKKYSQTSNRYGTVQRQKTKEYFINYDNKRNKLKPSLPVQKSTESFLRPVTDSQTTPRSKSKTRFSKVKSQHPNGQPSAHNQLFDVQLDQLKKVDAAQMSGRPDARRTNLANGDGSKLPGSQYGTPVQQKFRTNTLVQQGAVEKLNVGPILRNNSSQSNLQPTVNLYGFDRNEHFKNKQPEPNQLPRQLQRSRSNKQFVPEFSLERRMKSQNHGRPLQKLQSPHAGAQAQERGPLLTTQYRTISHMEGQERNNSKRRTHTRKNTDQFSNAKATAKQELSENLSQSYARFQKFEDNNLNMPAKSINYLIQQNQHTRNKIVDVEPIRRNKKMTNSFAKVKAQEGKKDQMAGPQNRSKQRTQHSKYQKKSKSTRNHYNAMKNEFLKNIRGNRKKTANPATGSYISKYSAPGKNKEYVRSHTSKNAPSKNVKVHGTRNLYGNANPNNYSKRTNSKKAQEYLKSLHKHRSVSNLHESSVRLQSGSFRNLGNMIHSQTGANKSSKFNNKT